MCIVNMFDLHIVTSTVIYCDEILSSINARPSVLKSGCNNENIFSSSKYWDHASYYDCIISKLSTVWSIRSTTCIVGGM